MHLYMLAKEGGHNLFALHSLPVSLSIRVAYSWTLCSPAAGANGFGKEGYDLLGRVPNAGQPYAGVCVCVCVCVCARVCICLRLHQCGCVCLRVFVRTNIYACVCERARACVYV